MLPAAWTSLLEAGAFDRRSASIQSWSILASKTLADTLSIETVSV
jgi:hypothetical protein